MKDVSSKPDRKMKIGLIDVDAEHFGKPKFPNLALMKLSAWHKSQGDDVEWWWGFTRYDRVYMAKVFDATYTDDMPEPVNAAEIIKGGTGYGLDNKLPDEVEHICPDYSLYPELTKDTAYGFLTRGCPRGCHFCIVAQKEGRRSVKVADLNEWWSGQKNIVLMDPNLLTYKGHMELLEQLIESKAWVDVNQGFDCRLLNEQNIEAINKLKLKNIHFAWDYMQETERVLPGLELYEYGHPFTKKTLLWERGVEPLKPTDIVMPERTWCPSGSYSHKHGEQHRGMFTTDRAKNRSKTFPGIARAMAEQWAGDAREAKEG